MTTRRHWEWSADDSNRRVPGAKAAGLSRAFERFHYLNDRAFIRFAKAWTFPRDTSLSSAFIWTLRSSHHASRLLSPKKSTIGARPKEAPQPASCYRAPDKMAETLPVEHAKPQRVFFKWVTH